MSGRAAVAVRQPQQPTIAEELAAEAAEVARRGPIVNLNDPVVGEARHIAMASPDVAMLQALHLVYNRLGLGWKP